MAIRKYKPTTPGRRGSSVADFVEVTRTTPEKSLTRPLPKKGGRNNQGRITTRHQGGGHKRAYRIIDFRRRSEEHTSELQSLMRISYAVFCLNNKNNKEKKIYTNTIIRKVY